MNPKKPAAKKAKSAGISLELDLIKRGKDFAKANGFGSLSNLVRFLITQELKKNEGETSYILREDAADSTAKPKIALPARKSSASLKQI